jgi:hypothetical protein
MQLLWTLVGVILLIWLIGFLLGGLGGLIHILLVIAVVVIIFRLLTGRTVIGGHKVR